MPSASTANTNLFEPPIPPPPRLAAAPEPCFNGNFDLDGADTIMRCRPEQDRELRAWQNIWGFYVQQSGPPPRCRRLTVEEARKVESMAKSGFLFEEIRASLGYTSQCVAHNAERGDRHRSRRGAWC